MFELKNFYTKDHNMFVASFTVSFKTADLNDYSLVNGQKGYFISPPSRKYQAKDGTTKYASYSFIKDESLREQILAAAIEKYESMKGGTQTTNTDPNDDIPF